MDTARDPGPDAAHLARFAAALARLWDGKGRIGLAVSGGPDSMAMLSLARAAIPDRIAVATVDHGLRPESAGEAAMVAEACHALGLEHRTLKVKVAAGNLQEQARLARYRALLQWVQDARLCAIMTAHHADDQAETLLMRLNRGSGVAGLAGVRETGRFGEGATGMTILRPLLGFRRSELAQVVDSAKLPSVADPSNHDGRFERVRIRQALAQADWLDPLALARSAAFLADADEVLESLAQQAWDEVVARDGDRIAVIPIAQRVTAMRVVSRVFAEFGSEPRGSDLARLLDRLEAGQGGNVAGILATVEEGQNGVRLWRFAPEPPRRRG